MNKNMIMRKKIILITGATHTGKTKLAQRMLEKYKYPYFSIDHLKMGLIRSGNTNLTVSDDDALTEYLWPIVRGIIKTVIENNQNMIVEGGYIPFDWAKDFDERYLPHIRYICLCMSDGYIEKYFGDIKKHSSDMESRLEICTPELLKRENRIYIENCKHYDCEFTLIDSDYEKTVNSLLE